MDKIKYVKKELEKTLVFSKKDDLIICIAGTIGVNAVNNLDYPISINQNVTSISVNNQLIYNQFLSIYLNTKPAGFFSKFVSIAIITYPNSENLKSIIVPLPPLPIQQKIATEVMSRRDKAKSLQVEAKEILEKAKKEFENAIL